MNSIADSPQQVQPASLRRKKRPFAFNVLLLGAGVLAALLAGEWMCRKMGFDEVYRQGLYSPVTDPELRYGLTPNHHSTSDGAPVVINELGYRQPPFAANRTPDVFRIVCVGDSFTFGMGVRQEKSWPARLGTRLAPPPGYSRVEVINAGVPGYNLKQYCRAVATQALDLQPDLILMGIVENDLEKSYFVENGYLCVPRKKTSMPIPGKRWLQTHSDLYQAINLKYQAWMAARLKVYNPTLAREVLYGDGQPEKRDETVAQLAACRKLVRDRGSDLKVVQFALSAESPLPEIVRRAEVPTLPLDLNAPHLRLADGHPNAQGHDRFAGQIATWLGTSPIESR